MDLRLKQRALLFKEGHMKEILVVMRGVDQNPVIKTKPTSIVRKMGTLNLNAISYRIIIRELLQIKRENNQKNSMKPVLRKTSIVIENSFFFFVF